MSYSGKFKLCDFGMAEFIGQQVAQGFGTKPYMAPEALLKTGYRVTAALDVWSLGITLFVMLTGDFPWLVARGSDPEFAAFCQKRHRAAFPWSTFSPPLLQLLEGMLSVNPNKRLSVKRCRAVLDVPSWFVIDRRGLAPTAAAAAAAAAAGVGAGAGAGAAASNLSASFVGASTATTLVWPHVEEAFDGDVDDDGDDDSDGDCSLGSRETTVVQ